MTPVSYHSTQGLTADEVRLRLATYGTNVAVRPRRGERLLELASMLADPMAIMLAIAGAAYLAMGERLEGAVLLGALIPVLGIDVLLEARSRGALKKLAASVGAKARVIRDGHEHDIPAEDLVPDDLLAIGEGDFVHADAIVISASNLATDESQLTGESEPKNKSPRADYRSGGEESRVYTGSRVLAGNGVARVTATGASSQYGKISSLLAGTESDRTPLQRRVAGIVRWTATAGIALSMAVFALELFRGALLSRAFLYAITLAMASVGEEFLLVLTLFLSVGAFRLGRRGVLARRISAVETLGSTTVICLDKTGTLTAGSYELAEHVPLASDVTENDLLVAAVLACEPEARDSMESIIVRHCADHHVDVAKIHRDWRLAFDYDFDPRGKHMSHVWRRADERQATIVAKGAIEGVLEHCAIDAATRARAVAANADFAARGMRVLAVAGRASTNLSAFIGTRANDERDLKLYGLLSFHDPIRPGVPAAIAECQRAGITLKLITGDHPLTAHAIADATGLAHENEGIVTGAEIQSVSAERLRELVWTKSIFARTGPEQKYAIVHALIKSGEVVAMTGDGINDAPALRRANIGVSMGTRATEVARAAAGLILLEDDFAALVATIRQGRLLFGNIQQAFRFLIGFKVMLVAMAFAPPLFSLPILLTPLNVVWLELIVHPVSALVFEGRDSGEDVMARPPLSTAHSIIPLGAASRSAMCGLLLAVGALTVYFSYFPNGEPYARGAAMVTAVIGSLLLILAELASDRPWWISPLPRDGRTWSIVVLVAATPILFTSVPSLARLLELAAPSWRAWTIAIVIAAIAVGWRSIGSLPATPRRAAALSDAAHSNGRHDAFG
jgi:Ca2+-transporting ATPase